jgi:hypothetical protein
MSRTALWIESAVERVTLTFEGRSLDFDLDHETCRWTAVEASTADLLAEGVFPLVAAAAAKRYELYSDGTFGEAEL